MLNDKAPVMELIETDILPLALPLLPGCLLPLRLYEPRFLEMLSSSLKSGREFSIVQIKPNPESEKVKSNATVDIFSVGTQVRVLDFDKAENGSLSIKVVGTQRVQIQEKRLLPSGVIRGVAVGLPERGDVPDEIEFNLDLLLDKLLQHEMMGGMQAEIDFDSPELVMNYLIMLLPLNPHLKQALVETDNLKLRFSGLINAITRLEQSA